MTLLAHAGSRRQFLKSAAAATAALWVRPYPLYAQHEGDHLVRLIRDGAAMAEIVVQRLRGNIAVLMGSGGNIAVLPGRDGQLLVDAGIPSSRRNLAKALAGISRDPIKHLINTHWHFDHTDGNEWLHSEGAAIVAHENTLKRLSVATRVEDWNYTFGPAPVEARPSQVFATERGMHVNDARIALTYYGPAHTDSDISVHFTDADVLHVGDTWWNGVYPFIDYSTGGSIDGSIRAAERNVERTTANTVVIPGHGPVGDRSGLVEFRDMLVGIRTKIAALKKQGRSLDDVLSADPTAAYDSKWGSLIPPRLFARLVYAGV